MVLSGGPLGYICWNSWSPEPYNFINGNLVVVVEDRDFQKSEVVPAVDGEAGGRRTVGGEEDERRSVDVRLDLLDDIVKLFANLRHLHDAHAASTSA